MNTSLRSILAIAASSTAAASLLLWSCGGKTPADGTGPAGDSTGDSVASDLDIDGPASTSDAGPVVPDAGPPAAPVTFVLKNSDKEDLAFNLDRGWQTAIQAYTGKPPKAVSVLIFPSHCTVSCETPAAEICPICEEPEKLKDIREAQKLEKVAAGAELEVPWDGEIYVYKKTKGERSKTNKRSCECFETEPAKPETYTVRACGLRLTTSASKSSKLQCVEAEMVLPSDDPQRVVLDFGAPSKPGKKSK